MSNLKKQPKTTIDIDYSRDELLDPYAISILKDRYLIEGETSPQDAFARASLAFSDDIEHAQRLYDYVSKLWFMYATPVLANGGSKRGLPISCFLNYVADSRAAINDHYSENNTLASCGGGLGGYWGDLRTSGTKTSSGGESTGMVPFLKSVDSNTMAFRQGGTRRAAYAAYLDISHPEIVEFINIRKPTGGDVNRKCLNLHHGVNITNNFMQLVEKATTILNFNDSWELKDPHTGEVKQVVSAKELWQSILETRIQTGEPYIHFVDTSNAALPLAQKILGLKIHGSNLCSEIVLPTSEDRTAVCCLSSVNIEKYDEWEHNEQFISDLIRMLDNVLDAFIEMPNMKTEDANFIWKARNSAQRERSLGLGAMGFHAYLQSKMIPFESGAAKIINDRIFSAIKASAQMASYDIARVKGVAPDYLEAAKIMQRQGLTFLKTNMRRNMHLLAIAPNASSSIICGNTSASIEPFNGNAYSQKTENGTNIHKNKYLEALLDSKGLSVHEKAGVWSQVLQHQGSVQSLKCLTDEEKNVFKTAFEIDQSWIIKHAADRQKYIDQAQSVNLFFKNPVDINDVHVLHLDAWKKGLKTLYYSRSMKSNRIEDIGLKFDRKTIKEAKQEQFVQTKFKTVLPNGMEIDCVGCEG